MHMQTRRESLGVPEGRADRRRLLRRVVLHVGFAVLLTVASAMACARFMFFTSFSVTIDRINDPLTRWPGPAPEGWPKTPSPDRGEVIFVRSADWWISPGRVVWHMSVDKALLDIPTSGPGSSMTYTRTYHGFPVPSTLTDWAGRLQNGTVWSNDARWPYSGVPVMRALPATTPLFIVPLVPWWPGFLANTLLIVGMTLGVQEAVRWVRRRRRRSRGLCVFCGYELVGMNPGGKCPECGGENVVVNARARAISGVS
jgi:hypothetical protein